MMIRLTKYKISGIRYFHNAAVFREEDHPRDESGKFGEGGSSGMEDPAIVNLPLSKRGDIDKQIDKYKEQQQKEKAKRDKKAETEHKAKMTSIKAKAKEYFDRHIDSIIKIMGGKAKPTEIKSLFRDYVSNNPERLVKIVDKFIQEGKLKENACGKVKIYRAPRYFTNGVVVNFDEEKHPRDESGRFGKGGGGEAGGDNKNPSENQPDSNLTEKQKEQVGTKQFKNWFGKSKVTDKNGNPLVVYHGTNKEFDSFSPGNIFFSKDMDYAEAMVEERGGGKVLETYVRIENPKHIKMKPGEFSYPQAEKKIIEDARNEGYDGLIIDYDVEEEYMKNTFFVAFSPEQIKSATDNEGSFDPNTSQINNSSKTVKVYRARA